MKTKVAVLLHGLGANGIDTLFANLSHEWTHKCDITYFIAIDTDCVGFWEDYVKQTNVKVIKLHDLDKGRLKIWPRTLARALKKYGPFDAIHSNMDMLNGINMVVAKLCGIKVRISHAHRSSSERKDFLSQCYRAVMKTLMSSFSTAKLACSDVAGDYFFGKGKYDLLFNGVKLLNAGVLPPPSSAKSCSSNDADRVETKPHSPVFCAVGRFSKEKNPFKILGVFKAVYSRIPDAILIWCGGGVLFNQVKAQADKDGLSKAINFVGITECVSSYLSKADYFLMPSLYEGLSLALVEAQAAGLVCFASDTCTKLSDCGMIRFVPLQSSDEEWADIIVDYIKNPPKNQLRIELLKRFDIKIMANKLEAIYQRK